MKKTVTILVAVGLLSVVGTTAIGGPRPGKDLSVTVSISMFPILSNNPPQYMVKMAMAVYNNGTVSTPACWLKCSATCLRCSWDVYYYEVPILRPGQSARFSCQAGSRGGTYVAGAFVDCYQSIAETSEANNFIEQGYAIVSNKLILADPIE